MRVVRIEIADELLAQMLTQDYEIHARCSSGLPEGAKLVNIERKWPYKTEYTYQHDDFENVEPGGDVPFFTVQYETIP